MCEAITDGNRVIEELAERLTGRYPCEDVVNPKTGELLVSREEMITVQDRRGDRQRGHYRA